MTSKEIAQLSGVSQSTVSRVLNQSSGVSEEKRKRVMEAVKKYNFELDANARGLRSNRVDRVAVILPDHFLSFETNLFWSSFYSCLHEELQKRGMLSVPIYGSGYENGEIIRRTILKKQADHVVLISTSGYYKAAHLNILWEKGIPFVCIYNRKDGDDYYPGEMANIIAMDFYQAGKVAADYLYQKGHRKMALMCNQTDASSVKRELGFRQEAMRLSPDCKVFDIPSVEGINAITYEGGYAAAERYMDILRQVTCLYATNDAAALGAIEKFQEAGGRVPEDLSVLGISKIPMSRWWHPHLTTMDWSSRNISITACKMLLEKKQEELSVVIPAILERESVMELRQM